jgi:hypothetical protein
VARVVSAANARIKRFAAPSKQIQISPSNKNLRR